MAVGALAGTASKRTWIVVLAAVALHFALDTFAHDPVIEYMMRVSPLWLKFVLILCDLGAGAAVLALAIRKFPASRTMILASGAASILPDALLHMYIWRPLAMRYVWACPVFDLHYAFHNRFGFQGITGAVANQVIAIAVPVGLILYLGGRRKKA